ncbi:MAG: phosphatidate cytidylyltransferase [Candidatus Omnitrophica bacterium]|nr:phosphatidate cytidylyltransferase [Candidatus Omnitrophota bacterium]MCB9746879.1 phosphatidate cytidylyltransferase [Candidatus Omnitrophota bacterium]
MSKDRLISSTIMITLTIFAVIYEWVFLLTLLALIIGGLYEFFYLIKKKGIPIYSYTGIFIGGLIPLSIYFRFAPTKGWELLFIVLLLLMIFFMQFMREDNKDAIIGISTTLFGVLYVSWFFSFLIKIRFLLPGMDGVKLLGFILLVTKCGDIGALLIGSKFGKHPLLPRVSPNKTIEGSIGSFTFSALAAVLGHNLIPAELHFSIQRIALMGIFFGGLGQIGDMSESLIKRDCQVKDSGKMLPALGGVLDAIDSLLFSAPAFYFYMNSAI